jgi:hypothetical protein
MAKEGTVYIGDVVKYTDKAKKHLGNAVKEDAKHYHIVKSVEHNGQMLNFEDGSCCDTYWVKVVARAAKI